MMQILASGLLGSALLLLLLLPLPPSPPAAADVTGRSTTYYQLVLAFISTATTSDEKTLATVKCSKSYFN